jgi:multiple sugar transport system permease protein
VQASLAKRAGRRRGTFSRRRQAAGLLFTLPACAFVTVFFFIPLGVMIWMSLNSWPLAGDHQYLGLKNYRNLASDPTFRDAFWFSLKFVAVVTPLVVMIGLGLAFLIKTPRRGVGIFRSLYFIPLVIGFAPAAYVWLWLLNPDVGLINKLRIDVGVLSQPAQWLASPTPALLAAVSLFIWKTVGFSMLLLMGGLQSIPRDIIEAASVDGAGRIRTFFAITLPLMKRTVALVVVFSTVGSFLVFEPFFILTRGGPGASTTGIVQWVFGTSFFSYKLGYGAAASVVLLLVLAAFTTVQLSALRDTKD